jgi:hypothetical protein
LECELRIAFYHEMTIAFVNQHREEIAMTASAAEHGLCWEKMPTGTRYDRELPGVSVGKGDVKMDV